MKTNKAEGAILCNNQVGYNFNRRFLGAFSFFGVVMFWALFIEWRRRLWFAAVDYYSSVVWAPG